MTLSDLEPSQKGFLVNFLHKFLAVQVRTLQIQARLRTWMSKRGTPVESGYLYSVGLSSV